MVVQPGCEKTLVGSHQGRGSPHGRLGFASGAKEDPRGSSLVGAHSRLLSARPVQYDEGQAHGHEHETQRCETSGLERRTEQRRRLDLLLLVGCGRDDGMYLDLGSRTHRLLITGDDADVKESRKDEDQTGSSGGTWDQRVWTMREDTTD